MEHAMNEKMREKVNEGKLDEATYKELVEELGRLKEEDQSPSSGSPDAPLYEVTYTENMIVANSRRSDDPPELQTRLALFKTDDTDATKIKIVRGVKDNKYCANYDAALLFRKFHEIDLNDDGELDKRYRPGYTMALNMWYDEMGEPENGDACMVIYTIMNVRKFDKKRKSHAPPEEECVHALVQKEFQSMVGSKPSTRGKDEC